MNVCTFVGTVGRDPEIKNAGGTKIANVRLAVKNRKKVDGEWKDDTLWLGVTFFGRDADMAERFVQKGSVIGVSGKLNVREYQGKDGTTKTSVEVNASSLDPFIGGKRDGGGSGGERTQSSGGGNRASQPADEDIPF